MAATLQELKNERRVIYTRMEERLAKAKQNNDGKLSAEERVSHKDDDAALTRVENDIKEWEADQKLSASLSSRKPADLSRKTQPDDIVPQKPHLGNQRLAAEEDPKKGFRNPREFCLAVMEAGRGIKVDERLEMLAAGSDEARTSNDPAGGYLVPEGFSPNLLQVMPEADPLMGRTTQIPMTNPIVKIPARVDKDHSTSVSGGLTVTRKPETVAAGSSQMTLERIGLETHALFGLSYATEEMLTDSPISFAAILSAGFSDQFTSHILGERITGTGIGEFLGVLNSPCLVSVAKETGQAATTLLYENVVKMKSRCWGFGKAVWLANHDVQPQLIMLNQAVGTGGTLVWQPSAREDTPDLLFGRPLIFTEYAKTLGTQGDVILGNWSEYLEGLYQPLQSAESIHVRFANHERCFKFWLRNAGAPWWRTALTPKNGTATLSPFVVCDTRS